MTIFWNGLGVLFCALAAIVVLRETRRDLVPYMVLTISILSYLSILPVLSETSTVVRQFSDSLLYGEPLLKGAGIAMLTEIGVEICRSMGESNTAGYVSLLGKAEILLMTLPLYKELLEMALEWL